MTTFKQAVTANLHHVVRTLVTAIMLIVPGGLLVVPALYLLFGCPWLRPYILPASFRLRLLTQS